MKTNSDLHHRQSIRLKGYDYSQAGVYSVTVCVQNRESLFGEISDGKMKLNPFGQIAQHQWHTLPKRYLNIELDEFIVMPNHIHGILINIRNEQSLEKIREYIVNNPMNWQQDEMNPSVTLKITRAAA